MRHRLYFVTALLLLATSGQAQTLEECQQAAERNYPLIRQRDLVEKMAELTVANVGKGWLPQVSASAQATLQSDVATFPDEMRAAYRRMGIDMKGLTKDQYRVGVDVSQTVFDGGAISRGKAVARQQGEVEAARTEVSIYQVRRRVNEMYFALLLLDEEMELNGDLEELLGGSERKLASMVKGGTAAECDLQNVKAERLNVAQRRTGLEGQRRMLLRMLSVFCGMEVTSLKKPLRGDALAEPAGGLRPEMRLFDAQLHLADAQERALDAQLLPKLGVFAQGFYGYPGLNMFEDMMKREWSLNGLVGARLTWNIGALYTRKGDKAKIQLQRDLTETNRDVFVFNNRLEQIEQNENISRYGELMAADEEIIELRSAVRKAAESKLAHGIIDVNDLVREINAENAARVQRSMHEIQLLKEICDREYTIGSKQK